MQLLNQSLVRQCFLILRSSGVVRMWELLKLEYLPGAQNSKRNGLLLGSLLFSKFGFENVVEHLISRDDEFRSLGCVQ